MRWIAIFEDHADREWVREQHSESHFEYLARHRNEIVIAGGLRAQPGAWYCGGLWVLEVDSDSEAIKLIEADPYFELGLRKSYRLFLWGKAPCYGVVHL